MTTVALQIYQIVKPKPTSTAIQRRCCCLIPTFSQKHLEPSPPITYQNPPTYLSPHTLVSSI